MNFTCTRDLWEYLSSTKKTVVMYGMGNGADKILAVCEKYGIEVCDFFASDGFVRGHAFHGKTVLSYSEIKEKYKDFIVLVSFAVASPIAWYSAERWLQGFVERLPVTIFPFAASLAIILLLTLAIVALQYLRAANADPSKTLKTE